jgi:hypothetical protein
MSGWWGARARSFGAGVLRRHGLRHLLGLGDPSGETYSGWVWAAVALMFAGLFLVQPRPTAREMQAA